MRRIYLAIDAIKSIKALKVLPNEKIAMKRGYEALVQDLCIIT